MKLTKREQKLVDIMFEIALRSRELPDNVTRDEHTAWVRKQLRDNGFPCAPIGMSHAVLTENQEELP